VSGSWVESNESVAGELFFQPLAKMFGWCLWLSVSTSVSMSVSPTPSLQLVNNG
jgi:hypothetical protein